MPRLTASFIAQPAPFGPRCATRRVRWSSTLRARATSSASPPTSATSFPSRVVGVERRPGESIRRAPPAATCGASSRWVAGCRVLISTKSLPATFAARNPSAPVNTRRTPLSSVMIDSTTSADSATARGLPTACTRLPCAAIALEFWSHAITPQPRSPSRCAIAEPMRPRPTRPTFTAKLSSPQPRLLHQRIDVFLEPTHIVDIAREIEQCPVAADLRQRDQAVGDLLGGADDRIAAPAGDEVFLHLGEHVRRERLGVGDHGIDQVGDRVPVALLIDVVIEIIARLLFGIALHHVGIAPHLQLAAIFLAGEVAIGVDLGLALVEIVAAENDIDHVAIFGREVLALLRSAGVHDRRGRALG